MLHELKHDYLWIALRIHPLTGKQQNLAGGNVS